MSDLISKTLEFCADCEKWFLAGPNERLCPKCRKKRIEEGQKRRRKKEQMKGEEE